MKLLFLDVDGVLNSRGWFMSLSRKFRQKELAHKFEDDPQFADDASHFDPAAVALLNQVVKETGASVVLSSSWRLFHSIDEMNKLLKEVGYDITFIHFGEHKVDGNPYEKLSPEVQKDIQKGVDASGEKFVSLVARNRNIGADKVKATEARTYRAEDALSLGLIDTIATPSQAMQVFFDELTGSDSNHVKEDAMTTPETKPGAQDQANTEAANAAAVTKAAQDAKTAERARVSGIQNCEEAKGKTKMANHLAMNTDMSVDEAKAMLAVAAKEAPETNASTATNGFQEAMDKSQHPKVGADAAPGTGGNESGDKASAILADFALAGGIGADAPK